MLIIKGGYAPVMLYMQGVGIILFSRSAILYRQRQISNEAKSQHAYRIYI